MYERSFIHSNYVCIVAHSWDNLDLRLFWVNGQALVSIKVSEPVLCMVSGPNLGNPSVFLCGTGDGQVSIRTLWNLEEIHSLRSDFNGEDVTSTYSEGIICVLILIAAVVVVVVVEEVVVVIVIEEKNGGSRSRNSSSSIDSSSNHLEEGGKVIVVVVVVVVVLVSSSGSVC